MNISFTFPYDELIKKGNLRGVTVDDQQLQIKNGVVDNEWLTTEVKKNCKTKTTPGGVVYYAEVPDLGENVEISNRGLTHGFSRPNDRKTGQTKLSAINTAKATLHIVDILQNSIEVNRSARATNANVPYTHVLVGVIGLKNQAGDIEYYAVRSMVEESPQGLRRI